MDSLILLFCSFIFCVIAFYILFQFLNDKFEATYENKLIYGAVYVISVCTVTVANMFMNTILNVVTNMAFFGLISYFLYYDKNAKKIMRVFETEVFFAVCVISEAFGACLIIAVLNVFNLKLGSSTIQMSIETMFSQLILIFVYYVIVVRLWKKSILSSKRQYVLYLTMFIYSMVNFLIVAVIAENENPILLLVIMGCTIFANMYFLCFIKYSNERNYYKLQAEMMEQQAKLQYESYEIQSDKYKEAMSILHDVDKHMKMIKELYQEDLKAETYDYIDQVREMLQPLVPIKYTENSVLNCLIFDKKRMADKNGILFKIDVEDADINFMQPIDITTLFGNLIDNAIAASKECDKEKYIGLFMKEYNEMVSIRIENTVAKPVPIKNGKIENARSKGTGIGLQNIQKCVQAYVGSIIYKYQEHMLLCDIVLNRTDD